MRSDVDLIGRRWLVPRGVDYRQNRQSTTAHVGNWLRQMGPEHIKHQSPSDRRQGSAGRPATVFRGSLAYSYNSAGSKWHANRVETHIMFYPEWPASPTPDTSARPAATWESDNERGASMANARAKAVRRDRYWRSSDSMRPSRMRTSRPAARRRVGRASPSIPSCLIGCADRRTAS